MSNAGIGLSPNKQAQTGKVAPTNVDGQVVKAGYMKGIDDGRGYANSSMPKGSLSAKDTGCPQNTGPRPTRNGFFETKQPHAPARALGTPSKYTGK